MIDERGSLGGSTRSGPLHVADEIHGCVEDAGDFEASVAGAEEDDLLALGRDAASGKEIGAEPVAFGILAQVS